MKVKLLLVLIAIVFACPAFGQGGSTKRVAILETVDKEGKLSGGLKLLIRGRLSTVISNTPGYEGYTRVDVASILSEQDFQRTGLVSEAGIKRLGELTGADYILIAEAAYIDSSYLSILAQIINVENAQIVQSADVYSSTAPEDLAQNCQILAGKLLNVSVGAGTMPGVHGGNNSGYGSSSDFVETTAGLNMKMVFVEGGEFMMGATSEQGTDAGSDEQVIRRVKLDSYYICECEVTQSQWEKVMGTSFQMHFNEVQWRRSARYSIGPDYPVYYVSWEEAQAFCAELSRMTGRTYCLPTEAQWEYAARGGKKADGTRYSGSNDEIDVAWTVYTNSSSEMGVHMVKTKRANGLGLYDMSGNVAEWCSDWYDEYNVNETNNPTGPLSGSCRVLRGGALASPNPLSDMSWLSDPFSRTDVTARLASVPDFDINSKDYGMAYYCVGFRVVLIP